MAKDLNIAVNIRANLHKEENITIHYIIQDQFFLPMFNFSNRSKTTSRAFISYCNHHGRRGEKELKTHDA